MSTEKASSSSVIPTGEFKGHGDICVLVVDCDPTCLMIVSGMLRALTYEVLTVDRAVDALEMTLERECGVDLVMTELHMPDMYGLDLLDEIRRTSKLPVVIMSADANEDVMLRSLRKGAEYYIVKPVLMDDVTNFWQYVFKRRRQQLSLETEKKESTVEVVESFEEEDESDGDEDGDGDEDEDSAVSDGEKSYQEPTKDIVETSKDDEEEDSLTSPMPKKAKLITGSTCTSQIDMFLKAGNSGSRTAGSGSGLCTNPIEEEQLIPPPQSWLPPPPPLPPQDQGTDKTSEAETEDGEGLAMAKVGDQLFPK